MATRLHFTKEAGAAVTYQNKYQVETDSIIEVEDQDVDALLATGAFNSLAKAKTEDEKSGKDSKTSNQKAKG